MQVRNPRTRKIVFMTTMRSSRSSDAARRGDVRDRIRTSVRRLSLGAVVVLALASPDRVQAAELSRHEFAQPYMGTTFRLVFYARGADEARQAADAAFARVLELDAILSGGYFRRNRNGELTELRLWIGFEQLRGGCLQSANDSRMREN